MTLLDAAARKRIKKRFQVVMWRFEIAEWYWLPNAARVSFRYKNNASRQGAKPIPAGAQLIGTYTKEKTEDFLDDLEDILALCQARTALRG